MPLAFEANLGQVEGGAYIVRSAGLDASLQADAVVFSLATPSTSTTSSFDAMSGGPEADFPGPGKVLQPPPERTLRGHGVGRHDAAAPVSGVDQLESKSNYLLGDDPSQWFSDLPQYAQVRASDVYPGIDVVYYGNAGQLQYHFQLDVGADPGAITLAFPRRRFGRARRRRQPGDLAGQGGSDAPRPVVYQQIDGVRHEVSGRFVLKDGGQVGFEVDAYDASQPLVIDPAIDYSTYLSGSGTDQGFEIAVDSAGNAYIVGLTNSNNFPTQTPVQGTVCRKLGRVHREAERGRQRPGVLDVSWRQRRGPRVGRRGGLGRQRLCDRSDQQHPTFPAGRVSEQLWRRGLRRLLAKLNAAGNALAFSTYLGGTGDDRGDGIGVDASGNVMVGGMTQSTNFPTQKRIPRGQRRRLGRLHQQVQRKRRLAGLLDVRRRQRG